jgi:peptidyl-prolyl cis-trans isomerase B (cyclophilin B)
VGPELGFRKEDEAKDLPRAKVTTNRGAFTIELWEDDTPNSVADFVWLARAKFYDGLRWHRVVPFFVIQGGDPFSRDAADPRVGSGGPAGVRLKTEKGKRARRAFRGVVGMANSGPDTDGSQFYVMTGSDRGLDSGYSLFGRVVEGMEVADAIVKGDSIVSVEIVRARDHEYRPVDATGKPVPEKPTAPR